jgi:hypothetical protein
LGRPKITNAPWTEEELSILEQMWTAGASIYEVSDVLTSRTPEAISNKVCKLKLQRPTPEINRKMYEKYKRVFEF